MGRICVWLNKLGLVWFWFRQGCEGTGVDGKPVIREDEDA